jgi:hypothetical protein
MATLRGFAGYRFFSLYEESAYDTAQTSNFCTENFIGGDFLTLASELTPDTDVVGLYEEASRQDELSRNVTGSHNQRLTPQSLALFASYCLGNSSVEDDGGGYYTHTISPRPKTMANVITALDVTTITADDPGSFPTAGTLVLESDGVQITYTGTDSVSFTGCGSHRATVDGEAMSLLESVDTYDLPSMTVIEMLGLNSTDKFSYPGVVVSRVQVEVARKQWATITADLVASGTRTTVTTSRPALESESPLKGGDVTIKTGGTWLGETYSGGSSINGVIRSFSWEFANELDEDGSYGLGGGKVRTRMERLRRSQTMTAEIELADSTYLDYLTGQTNLTMEVAFVGTGSFQAKLIFPRIRMSDIQVKGGVLMLTTDATFTPFQIANTGSVHVEVTNQVASYLQS